MTKISSGNVCDVIFFSIMFSVLFVFSYLHSVPKSNTFLSYYHAAVSIPSYNHSLHM